MITLLALILLTARLFAVYLLLKVIAVQDKLMKKPIDSEIMGFRRDLHHLSVALMLSNVPAIILDIFFVLKETGIVWFVSSSTPILVFYTISNALTAVLASVLISRIYRNALKADQSHEQSDHTLMNDE